MKRFSIALFLIVVQPYLYAGTGLLFKVSSSGLNISVTSTRMNHEYPAAGIKINTPGYSLAHIGVDCILANNGYCLFAVNDRTPTTLAINGPTNGTLVLSLCLNGKGAISCQTYHVSLKATRAQWIIVSDTMTNQILTFPANSNGNIIPSYSLTSDGVGITTPYGLYLDTATNSLWVSNYSNGTTGNVSQFNLPAEGVNLPPLVTLSGPTTTLTGPTGAATDSAGNLYVADYSNNSIDVFPPGSDSSSAPSRVIESNPNTNLQNTYLANPGSIGVTPTGIIYVANSGNYSVFSSSLIAFTAGSNGNIDPSNLYQSFAPGAVPAGLWIDSAGHIWVTDFINNTIQEFQPDTNGTFLLLRTIAGGNTVLDQPYGIAVDLAGYIYVACCNAGQGKILVFAPEADGNASPIQTITSTSSSLQCPTGLTIQQ